MTDPTETPLERAKRLEEALTDEDLATNSPALAEAIRAWKAIAVPPVGWPS